VRPSEVAEVRIPVPDRQGVLAEVTTLASELGVNIADLEIAHSSEGDAGVVILLIWLNLSSSVLLLGAELNAVIDLRRFPHPSAGDEDPVLPPKEPAET